MEMRLNTCDIYRLKQACKLYQEKTGSEWMWEQYDDLIQKLHVYHEEYCADQECMRKIC
jgi:hypothetical protein